MKLLRKCGCTGGVMVLIFACAMQAQTPLATTIGTLLADQKIEGAHWGISVTEMDGTPIYALDDDKLFQPASNVKLFTTAAALDILGPTRTFRTTISAHGILTGKEHLKGDLFLIGTGDANLSGRTIPYKLNADDAAPPLHYLEEMAAQVAQTGLKIVDGDLHAGDEQFRDQPYAEGWNLDDLPWGYAAPVSALSVNDNELKIVIRPATEKGHPASIEITPTIPYYTVQMDITTGPADSPAQIRAERAPSSKQLHLFGSIPLRGAPDVEHLSIDNPAEFAGIALKELLQQHGVIVTGKVIVDTETVPDNDPLSFREESREPIPMMATMRPGLSFDSKAGIFQPGQDRLDGELTHHDSPTVLEDVVVTNKDSLNLHAELLLRQMGWYWFHNIHADVLGARVIRQFAINAGVQPDDFIFYDGSGLSNYDVATPRAFTQILRYATTQPWGVDYKASLPVGGVDGTLEHRFTKVPLKGNVFAKTGTLSEDRALSGYVICASGKTVVFSILVGDHLPGSTADRDVMDKIVAAIAAAN
jgi:D-alanyl-D-alanine carboxypeptidase/D-alanyl-D-alanine-endopeptidase (penicillin-binding protein 4)